MLASLVPFVNINMKIVISPSAKIGFLAIMPRNDLPVKRKKKKTFVHVKLFTTNEAYCVDGIINITVSSRGGIFSSFYSTTR